MTNLTNVARNGLFRLLGVWPLVGKVPLSEKDKKKLYKSEPSISQFLPFKHYNKKARVFEFNDGFSCGVVLEAQSVDVESQETEFMNRVSLLFQQALQSIHTDVSSPWIVQSYLKDEPIRDLVDRVSAFSTPAAKKTPLHKRWMEELQEFENQITKPGGMFYDKGAKMHWSGQYRRIRIVIYRNSLESDWYKNGKPIPGGGSPASELNEVVDTFVDQLDEAGVKARRYDDNDLFCWLFPWFSPQPEGFDSAFDFLQDRKYAVQRNKTDENDITDLAELMFSDLPKTDKEGNWFFNDRPHRLISFQSLKRPPVPGIITADQIFGKKGDGKTTAVWDKWPQGCVFVSTIVIAPQKTISNHINQIVSSGKNASAASRLAGKQGERALNNMAADQAIYPAFFGVYVSADNVKDLHRKIRSISSSLPKAGLAAIASKHDPMGANHYIRHLPMVFNYEYDQQEAKTTSLTYVNQIVMFFCLYGRSSGTNNPGRIVFNRCGGPNFHDPIRDKLRVAHSFIFGPTGAGKSATLLFFILHSLATYLPRVYLIEFGNGFKLMGDFLRKMGITVNHVNFGSKSNVSLPPFANAFLALKQAEQDEEAMRVALQSTVDSHFDENNDLIIEDVGEDEEEDCEQRDYLGELEFAVRIMVTGGNHEAEKEIQLVDKQLIRSAILEATRSQKAKGEPYVLPSHLAEIFKLYQSDQSLSQVQQERFGNFSVSMNYWTEGARGKFFNRPGEAWPECDVTIVNLGILANGNNDDQLALTIISLINSITGVGEKYQHEDRPTEVYIDESHIPAKHPIIVLPLVFGTKTWRKLGLWLIQATQNMTDYAEEAKKMLAMAEWWLLIFVSDEEEIVNLQKYKPLTQHDINLLRSCKKQKGAFTDAILISADKQSVARIVPVSLAIVLAGTDQDEKANRRKIMQENNYNDELDAVEHLVRELNEKRMVA